MTDSNKPSPMNSDHFAAVRDVIARRAGVRLPDNKQFMLESRLAPRLIELGLDDFGQYVTLLTMGPYQLDEFQAMYSLLRMQEASFFRNEAQLEVFERRVLPQILEQRESTRRLRIWAAACGTGEEAYTLAILLHRALGGRLNDWRIEVFGTDVSHELLEAARVGVYPGGALRTTPEAVRSGFFTQIDDRWRIDADIRQMVSFGVLDLRDTLAAGRHGVWDVVFCRDAMAWCDNPTRRRIVTTLSNALADDGTLFIGDAENIRDVTDGLRPISVPQGYCYEKSCRPEAGRIAPQIASVPQTVSQGRAFRDEQHFGAWDSETDEPRVDSSHDDECAVTPIISSVHNVFSTMFQLPVSVGTPRRGTVRSAGRAISGTVEVSGDLTGSIALHFPVSTAESVVSLFCGHRLDLRSPDFADAIGELVGLVSGGAKSSIRNRTVSMSFPVVCTDSTGAADSGSGTTGLIIPCVTDRGSFLIEIAVKESSEALV